MPDFHTEQQRTARKNHTCCECCGVIPPGTTYFIIAGSWDGDFLTFKQCEHCRNLYQRACNLAVDMGLYPEDGPGLGMLYDWLGDCDEEDWMQPPPGSPMAAAWKGSV